MAKNYEYGQLTDMLGHVFSNRADAETIDGLIAWLEERRVGFKEPKYKADFLFPHEDDSIEEAGYEFANGHSPEYQKMWWDILVGREQT